jgi:hypothetical protein
MEYREGKSDTEINDIIDCRKLPDINRTTTLLMEEKLQDIQKDINEIINQAVKYQTQGNHIILAGYLAGGIARLNLTIREVLETVEMVKAMAKKAG